MIAVVSGSESELDEKILPYCDISKKQKKTLGEMEQEFLLALQVTRHESGQLKCAAQL